MLGFTIWTLNTLIVSYCHHYIISIATILTYILIGIGDANKPSEQPIEREHFDLCERTVQTRFINNGQSE